MGMRPYVLRSVYFDPESDSFDPGRTRQSFAADADMNNIYSKYQRNGILGDPSAPVRKMFFGDFTDVDFNASANKLASVKQAFDALPSNVRDRFDNDPAQLLDFIVDPANKDEAVELGLLELPAPEPVPDPVPDPDPPVVPDPLPAPPAPAPT